MKKRNSGKLILVIIISCLLITSNTKAYKENAKLHQNQAISYDPDVYTQVKSVNISNVYNSQEPGNWFQLFTKIEMWNPTSEDIFLNFSQPYTLLDLDIVYPCAITFDVNSDNGYDFSLWSIHPSYLPECLMFRDQSFKPGITAFNTEFRGFNYGNENEYFSGNVSISLKFANSVFIDQNEDLDQFYNLTAEIVDDEITQNSDKVPNDWGGLNTSQGLQMRIVSVERTFHYYEEAIWSIPVSFVSELVGSGSVDSPCVHLYSYSVSAWLQENRSSSEFKRYWVSWPDICSTAITTHDVSPGIKKINFLEIKIDFNSTFIPSGNYTFRLGLGYSPNPLRFTIEILPDQYFTSYYEQNQDLVYSTTEPLSTSIQSETNQTPIKFSIFLISVLIYIRRKLVDKRDQTW